MEIKTCEQYVLSELDALRKENESLKEQLREERENHKAPVVEHVDTAIKSLNATCLAAGRKKVVSDSIYEWNCPVIRDGKKVPFDEWCKSVVQKDKIPDIIGRAGFIREMAPELKEVYEEMLDEETGD